MIKKFIGVFILCFFLPNFFAQKVNSIDKYLNEFSSNKNLIQVFIILNTEECKTSCTIPVGIIFKNIMHAENLQWHVVMNENLTASSLNLIIANSLIDTSKLQIIQNGHLYNALMKKHNGESFLIIFFKDKKLFEQKLYSINFDKLNEIIDRHFYLSENAFTVIQTKNSYSKNLFMSCRYTINMPYFYFYSSSVGYTGNFNIQTQSYISEKILSFDSIQYFNIAKRVLDTHQLNRNFKIIMSEKELLLNNNISPVALVNSTDKNKQFYVCQLEYYSDTLWHQKQVINAEQICFLISADSLLNFTDTLFFDKNYNIIPESGGAYIQDSNAFYFLRYSYHLNKIVLSEFKFNSYKQLCLQNDVPITYNLKKDDALPILKLHSNKNILLFAYPKNKHSRVFSFNPFSKQFNEIIYRKNIFISYTLFYQNNHYYIYLINKNHHLYIEKFNILSYTSQIVLDVEKVLLTRGSNSSSAYLLSKSLPYFLSDNTILLLAE